MPTEEFELTSKVEIFPQHGGWTYITVPQVFTKMSKGYANRGLIPIVARIGNTKWNTSLLPLGNGTHFIALNKNVRKAENINIGDEIKVNFRFDI